MKWRSDDELIYGDIITSIQPGHLVLSSNTRALPWDQLLAFFTSLNGSISWSSPAQTMGSMFMSDKNGRFSCSLCSSNLLKMICRTDGQIPPPSANSQRICAKRPPQYNQLPLIEINPKYSARNGWIAVSKCPQLLVWCYNPHHQTNR